MQLAMIAVTAVCCILRVILKLNYVDPATGFYEGGTALYYSMNVLLVAGILVPLVLGRTQKNRSYSLKAGPPARITGALCGAAALWVGISELLFQQNFYTDPPAGDRACMILAILSGLVLLYMALTMGKRTNGILLLIPLVWQLVLALIVYNRFTLILHASDQRLSVLAITAFVLFFLANGRLLGDVLPERGCAQVRSYAPPAFLLSLTTAAGYLAAYFADKELANGLSLPYAVFLLAAGLYALTLYLSVKETN